MNDWSSWTLIVCYMIHAIVCYITNVTEKDS